MTAHAKPRSGPASPKPASHGREETAPRGRRAFLAALRNRGRPAGEREIAAFEREIGARLPPDHRRFLRTVNGGYAHGDWCLNKNVCVNHIHGLRRDFSLSLREAVATYCTADPPRMPPEVIPIADDPFGNAICLAVRGRHYGSIWFWDHEEESQAEPTWRNMQRVAPSLDNFLERLRVPPPEPLSRLERVLKDDDVRGMQRLIARGLDVNHDDDGFSLLERASIDGAAGVATLLLILGARVTSNALDACATNGHLRVVQILLAAGAKPDIETLYSATINRHVEIIRLLLAFGLDPTRRDEFGSNAIDIARSRPEPARTALLKLFRERRPQTARRKSSSARARR